MDETQDLALRALRELLDDPERNDWDGLLAANRALIRAIETGEPMTRRNARIVAEYLREAGWRERRRTRTGCASHPSSAARHQWPRTR
jgi:Xaa-Pro aminopeptidase